MITNQVFQMVFDISKVDDNQLTANEKDPGWQRSKPLIGENSDEIVERIGPNESSFRMK